jgi:hypothetical protein
MFFLCNSGKVKSRFFDIKIQYKCEIRRQDKVKSNWLDSKIQQNKIIYSLTNSISGLNFLVNFFLLLKVKEICFFIKYKLFTYQQNNLLRFYKIYERKFDRFLLNYLLFHLLGSYKFYFNVRTFFKQTKLRILVRKIVIKTENS